MALVYLVYCTASDKAYVGLSTRSVDDRWSRHLTYARLGGETALANAIRLHGEAAFDVVVLESGLTAGEAASREEALIVELGTRAPGGYNLTSGGEMFEHSDESKAKISKANKGRIRSPEHCLALSKAKLGKPTGRKTVHSEATRAKISASRYSSHLVQAALDARRGVPRPPEFVARMRATAPQPLAHLHADARRLLTEGLSHTKVAAALGISRATVDNWARKWGLTRRPGCGRIDP